MILYFLDKYKSQLNGSTQINVKIEDRKIKNMDSVAFEHGKPCENNFTGDLAQ